MKKILLIIVLLSGVLFSQSWRETNYVWNNLAHELTGYTADSAYFQADTGLVVRGTGDIIIHIPNKPSFYSNSARNHIRIWGYVTRQDSGITGQDSSFFAVSKHSGDGSISDDNFTPVWYGADTALVDSGRGTIVQFDVDVAGTNAAMLAETWSYVDLRISPAELITYERSYYIKIEWMEY